MYAIRFRVVGRVQGVGYRAYVRGLADELGVVGEVHNTHDRAVEGHAQSESEEHLLKFQARLGQGPGQPDGVQCWVVPAAAEHLDFVVTSTR